MQPGPNGFALAVFPGDNSSAIETELPNLMLIAKAQAVMKRPAGRGVKALKISTPTVSEEAVEAESVPKSPELVPFGSCDLEEDEGEEEEEGTEDEELEEPPAQEAHEPASIPDAELFKGDQLKVVYAAKQSYIQDKVVVAGKTKWRLVVAVSEGQAEDHKEIVAGILAKLKRKPAFSKAEALNLRTSSLKK
jgi:hypothetical protein